VCVCVCVCVCAYSWHAQHCGCQGGTPLQSEAVTLSAVAATVVVSMAARHCWAVVQAGSSCRTQTAAWLAHGIS